MKMWHKDYNEDVEVYDFDMEHGNALCYVPTLAGNQNGNGWITCKLKRLVPYPHAEAYKSGMSKTERNKIKSMLTLTYAEWTCTDGAIYTHAHLEDAIQHQAHLLEEGGPVES